jgi:hypothetical protein
MTYEANYRKVIDDLKVEETARAMTLFDERLPQGGLVLAIRSEERYDKPIDLGFAGTFRESNIHYFLDIGTLTSLSHHPEHGGVEIHLLGVEFMGDLTFGEREGRDTRVSVPYGSLVEVESEGREFLGYDWGVVIPGAETICQVLGLGSVEDYEGIMRSLSDSDMVSERPVMRRKGGASSIYDWRANTLVPTGEKYKVVPIKTLLEKAKGKEPKGFMTVSVDD